MGQSLAPKEEHRHKVSGAGTGDDQKTPCGTVDTAKTPLSQAPSPTTPPESPLSTSERQLPRKPSQPPAAAGSVLSEPWKRSPKPLAHSAKTPSSPKLPQRAQDRSRGAPKYAKRSGIGPQQALEAITKAPRAQRESPILPRASSARAGPIPRSAQIRPAERDRSAASLGRRTSKPLAQSAKIPSSPEPPQRA